MPRTVLRHHMTSALDGRKTKIRIYKLGHKPSHLPIASSPRDEIAVVLRVEPQLPEPVQGAHEIDNKVGVPTVDQDPQVISGRGRPLLVVGGGASKIEKVLGRILLSGARPVVHQPAHAPLGHSLGSDRLVDFGGAEVLRSILLRTGVEHRGDRGVPQATSGPHGMQDRLLVYHTPGLALVLVDIVHVEQKGIGSCSSHCLVALV
mmetsp:Transcript_18629/g.41335  ORF Transcript_18629/g.41335 Transcript_18629/m.41335 type:complete len:205 (-) Transcript_18629:475-1089(-)